MLISYTTDANFKHGSTEELNSTVEILHHVHLLKVVTDQSRTCPPTSVVSKSLSDQRWFTTHTRGYEDETDEIDEILIILITIE